MRLMIAALLVVLLVVIDQFRFHGYYGSQLSNMVQRVVYSFTR
jgi:hypothetical protein